MINVGDQIGIRLVISGGSSSTRSVRQASLHLSEAPTYRCRNRMILMKRL